MAEDPLVDRLAGGVGRGGGVAGSHENGRFSKMTMFPSNEAPLEPLVCWAVTIQENRQSCGLEVGCRVVEGQCSGPGRPCWGCRPGSSVREGHLCSSGWWLSCQTTSSGDTKMLGTAFAAGMTAGRLKLVSRCKPWALGGRLSDSLLEHGADARGEPGLGHGRVPERVGVQVDPGLVPPERVIGERQTIAAGGSGLSAGVGGDRRRRSP